MHIVSFILLHIQLLKRPVRRKYSTDMFCKYFRKLRLTKKSRIMKLDAAAYHEILSLTLNNFAREVLTLVKPLLFSMW